MKVLFFLLTLLSVSCASDHTSGDRHLSEKEAPTFLKSALPQSGFKDVEYFIKKSEKETTYEVKYTVNGAEVSLTFSDEGKMLEREEDIKFTSLSSTLQNKINAELKSRYGSFRITETEKRTDEQQRNFIDVEIISKKSKTGFLEVSFTPEGIFVSEEEESVSIIDTLN